MSNSAHNETLLQTVGRFHLGGAALTPLIYESPTLIEVAVVLFLRSNPFLTALIIIIHGAITKKKSFCLPLERFLNESLKQFLCTVGLTIISEK